MTAETTLAETGLRERQTTAYFGAFIALGLVTAVVGPTLPGLAAQTRVSLQAISVLFAAQQVGFLFGALSSGHWYDHRPAHRFLAGMTLLMALMLALTPMVRQLWLLSGMIFFIGIGLGSIDVGGNMLMIWVHHRQVGPRLNALHFFFGLGALLSPVLVAQALVQTGGIAWAYWLLALLLAPLPWLFWQLPSPSPHHYAQAMPSRHQPLGPVILFILLFVLYVGAELAFGGWIYTYSTTLGLATMETAGYLTSLFWGALTLGRLLAIRLAVRYRPSFLLLFDWLGIILFLLLLALWGRHEMILWIATAGVGLAMASVFPSLIALAEKRLFISGQLTSWFLIGSSLGGMSLPWLIGQLFESEGPHAMISIILAAILCALIVFGVLQLLLPAPSRAPTLSER